MFQFVDVLSLASVDGVLAIALHVVPNAASASEEFAAVVTKSLYSAIWVDVASRFVLVTNARR